MKRVHFVGIGGAGVSGLARIALQAGLRVSGSDLVMNDLTRRLSEQGATVHDSHQAAHVPHDANLCVISAAIKPDNPEVLAAREAGIRVCKYAEALGEFTRGRTNLCVAGTHGKTTTTAMLAQILRRADKGAGWLVGGEPVTLESPAAWGEGSHFVMESCEYDRSFMKLKPSLVVLNNIELDHMDVYGDLDGVAAGFLEFVLKLPPRGMLVYNADDPRCREIARRAPCPKVSFGVAADADWRLCDLDVSSGFARAEVTCRGLSAGRLVLEVPGRVNAVNALGALAAANWAGVPTQRALTILRGFGGVKRRFEMLGSVGGVPMVDDYAHHPTAVRQLLETARATFVGRSIVAVFQAHQYQRINTFMAEFADALALADRVLIARTYAAREQGVVPGEPEERLAKLVRQLGADAMAYSDFDAIVNDISLRAAPRDAVLFIGAGDVNGVAARLLERRKDISDRLRSVKPALTAGSAS
ncbi:MAG: UDP-N-acetylmuramate--L-alanine ligase [Planctomycetes bacterium]|jgi:UDP-N-acetylmuramate--alanine ligase|nr:UDP-N-acetylmuramate--L-alanine ligase [Planctomycetota bacterium]MCL4729579.1 UDP-N-acetylmuramate--L-alanine ligase [Planctomycetota bacterium]